ncbi:hypothetical protein D3C81_2102400 [compost metagenome]
MLEQHSWPGNTRELENVIHFALLVSSGDEIAPEHLNLPATEQPLQLIERWVEQWVRSGNREPLDRLKRLLAHV